VQCNIVGETPDAVKRVWYREKLLRDAHFARFRFAMSAVNAHARHLRPPADERAGPTYSISELAREFALTTRAIRFYEDEGLLAPRRRGLARIYGERERTRIKLILRGKRLGLALSEIRDLFDIYATAGNERHQLVRFLQLLADRSAMLHQQREDIDAVLAEIAVLDRDCRRRLRQESAPPADAPGGDGALPPGQGAA
jgi:DNA-binding transcriptional MerR regulator